MKKVILVGDIDYIKNIINSFEGIERYILYATCKSLLFNKYKNVNFYKMDFLKNMFFDCNLVICSQKEAYYKDLLVQKYNINPENIGYYKSWLLMLLKENLIVHKPKYIRLDISTLCQLNCVDCYMRKNNFGKLGKGYLSFSIFKKFIDSNDFIESIEISNSGEILLNPDLDLILKYAYEKNVEITVFNGVNFNNASDKILESLVKYNVKGITFSIDGASQEVYSKYRRNGNINNVFKNIEKLNLIKKEYNSYFPELCWQYILMEHNICDITKAIELAPKYNMLLIFKEDWSGKFKNQFSDLIDKKLASFNPCEQMLFSPQINWDGRLLGCCVPFWDDWKINVFELGLIETLKNDNYRRAVYRILGEKIEEENNPCFSCNYYKKSKNN